MRELPIGFQVDADLSDGPNSRRFIQSCLGVA